MSDEPIFGSEPSKLREIRPSDVALRFAFGAAISVVAGVVSLIFGPKAGGMFLAFPAILPAALTLIEKKEGLREALHDIEGAVFGAFGLVAFAIVAALTLPGLPVGLALGAAFTTWLAISVGSYLAYQTLRSH